MVEFCGGKIIFFFGELFIFVFGVVDGWFELYFKFGKFLILIFLVLVIVYVEDGFFVMFIIVYIFVFCLKGFEVYVSDLEEFENVWVIFFR